MKLTNSISRCFIPLTLLASCAVIFSAPPAGGQATFRVVSYLNQIQYPIGLTEWSPGLFYSIAGGSSRSVFS